MVRLGLTPRLLGTTLPSQTYNPGWPNTSWLSSITPSAEPHIFSICETVAFKKFSARYATAYFIETERHALAALRANVTACKATDRATVIAGDALRPKPGVPCGLVFLDPPYAQDLVPKAIGALDRAGWIAPGALVIAETGRDEELVLQAELCAERIHGAARITAWRMP